MTIKIAVDFETRHPHPMAEEDLEPLYAALENLSFTYNLDLLGMAVSPDDAYS